MTTGALVSSGFFFLVCFSGCLWFGASDRIRGVGRAKWWGENDMEIHRPPINDRSNRNWFEIQPGGKYAVLNRP